MVSVAQTVRKHSLRKRLSAPEQEERQALLEGLDRTKVLIQQAYACFNRESNPDLIESYVFEINALQSRYSYLLKRVRELEETETLPAMEA